MTCHRRIYLFPLKSHLISGRVCLLIATVCIGTFSVLGSESQRLSDLQKENDQLKKELEDYKTSEEDRLAWRVFDKSKKLLYSYLTLGGLAMLIIGILGFILGFKGAREYMQKLGQKKIETFIEDHAMKIVKENCERQVSLLVQEQASEIILLGQRQATRLMQVMDPIAEPVETQTTSQIPTLIDYTDKLLPIRNQGREGSSVGFAVAAALEYQIFKQFGEKISISPRFIYYFARKHGKFPIEQDHGARIRDAIEVLIETGAIAEEAWPYEPGNFSEMPPRTIEIVRHYRVVGRRPVYNALSLRKALETFGPVPGGITMYDSWSHSHVGQSGRIPMPTKNSTQIGAHALCFVGYDNTDETFKFRNHWGLAWGDQGYGYISYEYVDSFLNDAWAIYDVHIADLDQTCP